MAKEQKEKKKSNWLLWVLLIFFPPAGIPYMWITQKDFSASKKKILSAVSAVWFVIAMIFGSSGSDSNVNTPPETSPNIALENNQETDKTDETDKQTDEPENASDVSDIVSDDEPDNSTVEPDVPFIKAYDNEIVVSAKMILDNFITGYKIPLAPQLWTIADFDEDEAIMTDVTITEESTNTEQIAIVVLTPVMNGNEMTGATPHYVSVGDTVYGDDGYCNEFFSDIESTLNNQTPDESEEKPVEQESSNALIAATVQTADLTNGTRAYIEISKEVLKAITIEEYAEFAENVVKDSGYNWFSIICDDGTGIFYAGSMYYVAEYGKLDSEGCTTEVTGYISLTDDGYSYEEAADESENSQADTSQEESSYSKNNNFDTYDNEEQQQTTETYVLNTSTRKFHYPSCKSVKKIAPKNYSTSSSSRSDLMAQGYDPCGNCKP